jgi:A/G-specific adenine glycosylase
MSEQKKESIQPTETERRAFRGDLLDWYDDARREMPWRGADDPYRIWLSEVMLQQTRVDQATPYYERFTSAFPTVHDLAEADRDEVMRLWEGLGYYSRARRLHEAAGQIVSEHAGEVPSSWDAISELPGVGPYTAAAVLSIAHDEPHAVLDGNVKRVLSRVWAVDDVVSRAPVKRRLRALANELLNPDRPGDFNQALMELGATVCTPTSPRCETCPLESVCRAHADGEEEAYPVKKERKPVPHHDVAVGLVRNDAGELLIQKRPDDGLLGGLWEFPGGKQKDGETLSETCRRELREEIGVEARVGGLFHRLRHAYSHFKITLHAFDCRIEEGAPAAQEGQPVRWVGAGELDDYAFPRANRKLIEELYRREKAPELFD